MEAEGDSRPRNAPCNRSSVPGSRGIEQGRLRSRTPAQRQSGLAAQHLAHGEAQQPLRALEGRDLGTVPDDLRVYGEVQGLDYPGMPPQPAAPWFDEDSRRCLPQGA